MPWNRRQTDVPPTSQAWQTSYVSWAHNERTLLTQETVVTGPEHVRTGSRAGGRKKGSEVRQLSKRGDGGFHSTIVSALLLATNPYVSFNNAEAP